MGYGPPMGYSGPPAGYPGYGGPPMGFGGYAGYGAFPPHHPMFGRGGGGPPMSRDQYEAMMRGGAGRRSHARCDKLPR